MAITIHQSPDTFTPVYNPVVFVASSTNVGENNFSYVFDLYIGGVLQTRHRIPANPSNGYAKIDCSSILGSEVTHDLLLSTTGWAQNTNSFIKFQVKIGEEYDVADVATLYTNLATSSSMYAFNSVFDYFDFVDYESTNYLLEASTDKFLTNAPDQYFISGDKGYLYLINNDPTTVTKARFKKYSAANVLLATADVTNSVFNTNTDNNRFLRIGVGPENLETSISAGWTDNASHYTCQIFNGSTAISEIKTFYMDEACKYTPVRLHFLNKLGGFDSFNFKLASKSDSAIERKTYKKLQGSYSGASFVYSKSDRSQSTVSTQLNDTTQINSDWLTEEENVWLKELVSSPVVLQELNGELLPITIQETKYSDKKKENEKLFNLQLNFNYSHTNYRQRY